MKAELIKMATEAGDLALVEWLKTHSPERSQMVARMAYYKSH